MIVQCPYCATRYQVDAARLAGPNPMLKCSRCKRIFPTPTPKKSAPPAAEKSTRAAGENLTLPFDEGAWKDEAEAASAPDLDISEPDEGFTLGTGDAESDEEPAVLPAAAEPEATRKHPAAAEADEQDEIDIEPDEEPEEAEERKRAPRPKRAARGRARERRTEQGHERGKVWALLIFLLMVVSAYAVVTRALFASPALCDRLIGRLPLVGAGGDDRLLTRKVALSEVVGSYQRIKDGKQVFVISGKALNTAPVALHGVQIAGTLYDAAGRTVDEKTISCGNVISAKVLKDLTPQEVSILQKLSPPKRFMIEPGESSTFVIVFMEPPHDAAEFSTRVVAAQRQA
ncbi:MAG TPA: DUF3426 domain-containing protein [Candidatus Acidoferrales bacterium]|nr:DUF3426 domain-containing protein [Candidatus Acidoferrales bacterium]